MQSSRVGGVLSKIVLERKIVHYPNNDDEGRSLEDLKRHLETTTDYVNIFIYDPPSPKLIEIFSQLPDKIKYIR